MSYGVFTDKTHTPSEAEIVSTAGEAINHWQILLNNIHSNYKTCREWKFYGVIYGWAMRFKKSGLPFVESNFKFFGKDLIFF